MSLNIPLCVAASAPFHSPFLISEVSDITEVTLSDHRL